MLTTDSNHQFNNQTPQMKAQNVTYRTQQYMESQRSFLRTNQGLK